MGWDGIVAVPDPEVAEGAINTLQSAYRDIIGQVISRYLRTYGASRTDRIGRVPKMEARLTTGLSHVYTLGRGSFYVLPPQLLWAGEAGREESDAMQVSGGNPNPSG